MKLLRFSTFHVYFPDYLNFDINEAVIELSEIADYYRGIAIDHKVTNYMAAEVNGIFNSYSKQSTILDSYDFYEMGGGEFLLEITLDEANELET